MHSGSSDNKDRDLLINYQLASSATLRTEVRVYKKRSYLEMEKGYQKKETEPRKYVSWICTAIRGKPSPMRCTS